MLPFLPYWKKAFLDALFPPLCIACEKALTSEDVYDICGSCADSFSLPESFTCPVCRGRIPFLENRTPPLRATCHPQANYLLLACSFYDHPVPQRLIQRLKFERRFGVAAPLGLIAARALRASGVSPDAILMPIPLSTQRLRERGFNQAKLIAESLATVEQRAYLPGILHRTRNTSPQTSVGDWKKRARNVADAFALEHAENIRGRSVVLIDDVWTSGATMNAASQVLKDAGSGRIFGLVISRVR